MGLPRGQRRGGHLPAAAAQRVVHHMIWDGIPDIPEDESEQESWAETDGDVPFIPDQLHDAEAPWRGLEHPEPPLHLEGWPRDAAGGIYELLRSEVEDEERNKKPTDPEDGS